MIFGCSFAFGSSLKPDENFGYKLAEKLNSVVYNRAFPGWGVQHMLMLLEDKHSLNNIDEADTVIYLYIEDHLNRLNSYYWGWSFYNVINQRYFLKKANSYKIILTF